jgi:hypothetical protein
LSGSDGEHLPLAWSPGAPPELEEALERSFDSDPGEDGTDTVRWTCPRCNHLHVRSIDRDFDWAGLFPGSDSHSEEIVLRCECGLEHAGRPAEETGCGYRKVVSVEEES